MRVSEVGRFSSHLSSLQAVTERMDQVQRQLASGRKLQIASDDPPLAAAAMRYRRDIALETQMRRNIEGGRSFMTASEAALSSATESLQRVRELTIQASSDTLTGSERALIADEVDQLLRELVQVGNSKFGDVHLFSGHLTNTPAYSTTGDPPSAVSFDGDTGQRLHTIAPGEKVAVNIAGVNVFGGVFADLITLRDNLNGSQPGAVIETSLPALDLAIERVISGRAEIGARINRLEKTARQSEESDIVLRDLKAQIEEIDLVDASIALTGQQTALQAAMSAIAATSNLSLINFLR